MIDWSLFVTLILGILGADVVKITATKIYNYFNN